MKMGLKVLVLALSFVFFLSLSAFAASSKTTGIQPVADSSGSSENVTQEPYLSNITLGSQFSYYGRTLPYVDWLIPMFASNSHTFFLNPRYVNTANGKGHEGNYGAGFRQLLFNDSLILGANAYYDCRKSESSNYYSQVGAGLEALSEWADLRFNYYWPLTEKHYLGESAQFGETKLLVYNQYEEPLQGFDAEGGVLIPYISDFMETRLYAGGYHYTSSVSSNVSGFKFGAEVHPLKNMAVEFGARHDNIRDTEFFGTVRINVPFSFSDLFARQNPFAKGADGFISLGKRRTVKERMNEIVRRDIDIVTKPSQSLNNDLTEELIYVNNTNSHTGEGTLSNPYHALESAFTDVRYLNNSHPWIYVDKGDGTSEGYVGQYTLKQGSTIWGDGYQYLGLAGKGFPIIEATDVDASRTLTLSGNNQVMGLEITNGADAGIYAENVNNLNIHNNIITGNGSGSGFDITGGMGFNAAGGVATLNTGSGNLNNIRVFNNIISANGLDVDENVLGAGILYGNVLNSGSMNVKLNNNTIADNGLAGILAANSLTAGASLYTEITHNVVSGNGAPGAGGPVGGIVFINAFNNATDGEGEVITTLNSTISDNIISDNINSGLVYYGINENYTHSTFDISNNIINSNGGQGIGFTETASLFTSYNNLSINISHNTINGNNWDTDQGIAGIALTLQGSDNDVASFSITNNEVNDNRIGMFVYGENNSYENITTNISNNTVRNNDCIGIATFYQTTEEEGSYNITSNTISNNIVTGNGLGSEAPLLSNAGIALGSSGNDNDTHHFVISNNQLSNNLKGVYIDHTENYEGNLLEANITDNTIVGGENGIYINSEENSDDATLQANISGNTITGNVIGKGPSGIYLINHLNGENTVEEISLSGNTITDNLGGISAYKGEVDSGSFVIDAGGGDLESEGLNSIYNNTGDGFYDVYNETPGTITAQNNWWGQAGGPIAGQISGDVDASNPLPTPPSLLP